MWKKTALIFGFITLVFAASIAPAWWVKGHETITEAAASAMPADVPGFFRAARSVSRTVPVIRIAGRTRMPST